MIFLYEGGSQLRGIYATGGLFRGDGAIRASPAWPFITRREMYRGAQESVLWKKSAFYRIKF
jgi:hypothetical protein